MGEQLLPMSDTGVHLPLKQRPIQVGSLASYLYVIEHIPFLSVQFMPQNRTPAAALSLAANVRVIAHLPFLGVPVEGHMLPAGTAIPLPDELSLSC